MTKRISISIITPTFNAGSRIESVILSVVGQSYNNIEHIIVDNLSLDATFDVVSHYQKKLEHIKAIREKDSGVYDAMNKGIRISSGDFVYFLGSDDEFHDSNVLMDIFNSGLFDLNAVIYGNVRVHGDTGWARDGDCYDGKFTFEKILCRNICHQAIFYPRNVFDKVGFFNPRYKINADWDFNLRCWSQVEFVFFDRIIANFGAGGVSTNGLDVLFRNDFGRLIQDYFDLDEAKINGYLLRSAWGDLVDHCRDRGRLRSEIAKFLNKVISYYGLFVRRS